MRENRGMVALDLAHDADAGGQCPQPGGSEQSQASPTNPANGFDFHVALDHPELDQVHQLILPTDAGATPVRW